MRYSSIVEAISLQFLLLQLYPSVALVTLGVVLAQDNFYFRGTSGHGRDGGIKSDKACCSLLGLLNFPLATIYDSIIF